MNTKCNILFYIITLLIVNYFYKKNKNIFSYILIYLILFILTFKKISEIYENFHTDLKIGIFVISVPDDHVINDKPDWESNNIDGKIYSERFLKEKELWKKYMNLHPNFKVHFLECNRKCTKTDIFNSECIDCDESYLTGIYEKTYLAYQEYNNYDIYIRTNLSTFYIFDKIYEELKKLPKNRPIYTGASHVQPRYGTKWNISNFTYSFGTLIVMNKMARNLFVDYGKAYIGIKEADDILISKIFYDLNISHNLDPNLDIYNYEWNLSVLDNLKNLENNSVIRFKNNNIDINQYQFIINKFISRFYNCNNS